MSDKTYNARFICTVNSASSVLTEALLSEMGKGRFSAFSAGGHPKCAVHPALRELKSRRILTDGLRSKSWEDFASPRAPEVDLVFMVCDQALVVACPVSQGQSMTAHWGMADPAAAEGSEEAKARTFLDAAITIKHRLEPMRSLPTQRLDGMALQKQVKEIGTR